MFLEIPEEFSVDTGESSLKGLTLTGQRRPDAMVSGSGL
jgi:hypothetical protein